MPRLSVQKSLGFLSGQASVYVFLIPFSVLDTQFPIRLRAYTIFESLASTICIMSPFGIRACLADLNILSFPVLLISYIPRRYILYSRRTLSRDNCYCFSRITTPVLVFCRRRKQVNGTLCSAHSLAYLRLVFYSGHSEFVPASAGTKILCCVIDSSPRSVGHSM